MGDPEKVGGARHGFSVKPQKVSAQKSSAITLSTDEGKELAGITITNDGKGGFIASAPGLIDSGQLLNALSRAGYTKANIKFEGDKWTVKCEREEITEGVMVESDGKGGFIASASKSMDSGVLLSALITKGYSKPSITLKGDKWIVQCSFETPSQTSPEGPAVSDRAFVSAPATSSQAQKIEIGQSLPPSGVIRMSIDDPRLNVGKMPKTFTAGPLNGWSIVDGAGDSGHIVLEKAPPSSAAFTAAPARSVAVDTGYQPPHAKPLQDGDYKITILGKQITMRKVKGEWYLPPQATTSATSTALDAFSRFGIVPKTYLTDIPIGNTRSSAYEFDPGRKGSRITLEEFIRQQQPSSDKGVF